MTKTIGSSKHAETLASLAADAEDMDPVRLLSAAAVRIDRLEKAVAELMMKNERLRQDAYTRD